MRSQDHPSLTCWSKTPTPAIWAIDRTDTNGAMAAVNARHAACVRTDLRSGRTRRLADDRDRASKINRAVPMFFVLSKILGFFAIASNVIVFMGLCGAL